MASLFGFEFKKRLPEEEPASFAPPVNDDGAVTVAAGGAYGTFVDLEGTARTEAELVTRYRDMSLVADVERAVDEIVNECIVSEIKDQIVQINLDKLQYPDNIKQLISTEFENIKSLLNFENQAYEIFRKWYVDGRLYYHVIIDDANPRLGIKEIRNIDPRKIRKVREQKKKRDPKSSAMIIQNQKEYFMYNEKGYNAQGIGSGQAAYSASGVKIAKDSIVHCVSGLMDTNGTMVLSYLHKAIKPLNQLRVLEDATVIYRISRAPERRIFYIDVGNLPKMKAEQYLRDMMVRHKNRLVYDASTGEVRDDRKFMTMLEDYWLPRREGGKGTEITTLPAGENLGKMEDVEYFQKKLFQSLNVPVTRLQTDQIYSIGKATEITRDEVKFSKFINRLRNRFSVIFLKCLEKQLVLKGIVTTEDWKVLSQSITFEFASDEYYQELKDTEMYMSRVNAANALAPYIGKYYSHGWVRKNIFKQSMEDMNEQDNGIVGEYKNQVLYPPAPEQPQQ
jgi:Bacteriophage T4-like portal protein (Gp20)